MTYRHNVPRALPPNKWDFSNSLNCACQPLRSQAIEIVIVITNSQQQQLKAEFSQIFSTQTLQNKATISIPPDSPAINYNVSNKFNKPVVEVARDVQCCVHMRDSSCRGQTDGQTLCDNKG